MKLHKALVPLVCSFAALSERALSKQGVVPCDASDTAQKWALRNGAEWGSVVFLFTAKKKVIKSVFSGADITWNAAAFSSYAARHIDASLIIHSHGMFVHLPSAARTTSGPIPKDQHIRVETNSHPSMQCQTEWTDTSTLNPRCKTAATASHLSSVMMMMSSMRIPSLH